MYICIDVDYFCKNIQEFSDCGGFWEWKLGTGVRDRNSVFTACGRVILIFLLYASMPIFYSTPKKPKP